MNKFQFAPGLPGYGTKGADGLSGLNGLGLYFSAYDGFLNNNIIISKIQDNKYLTSILDASLPGFPQRTYQIGDIFIDPNSRVFEITSIDSSADYSYTGKMINNNGIFIPGVNLGSMQRFSNDYLHQKVVVDDVLINQTISDYTSTPINIYGWESKEFGKIHFVNNIKFDNDFNPYVVYTSGVNDENSIAIVRDKTSNSYRFGNLDSSNNVRNVSIMFDVSLLKVSKDTGSLFNNKTPTGTVLTNYEINSNSLFNPSFNKRPLTFSYIPNVNDVSIIWNKADFVNNSNEILLNSIKADLYFYKKNSSYNNISVNFSNISDTSIYSHLVFHNIDSSGALNINGLEENTLYEMYINFKQNGWNRTTDRIEVLTNTTGGETTYLTLNPESNSSINSSGISNIPLTTLSTNATWALVAGPEWATVNPTSGSPGDASIYFTFEENTSNDSRTSDFVFSSGPDYTNSVVFSTTQVASTSQTQDINVTVYGDGAYDSNEYIGDINIIESSTGSILSSVNNIHAFNGSQYVLSAPTNSQVYIENMLVPSTNGSICNLNDLAQWHGPDGVWHPGTSTDVFTVTQPVSYTIQHDADLSQCLVKGTLVTLPNGLSTSIENLYMGKELMSAKIKTLEDVDKLDIIYSWRSTTLEETRTSSPIQYINGVKADKTIIINNGLLEATPRHTQLIQRDNVWQFTPIENVKVGDKLYDINKKLIDVISVEINNEERIVYPLKLDPSHTYFANGILTHNNKQL